MKTFLRMPQVRQLDGTWEGFGFVAVDVWQVSAYHDLEPGVTRIVVGGEAFHVGLSSADVETLVAAHGEPVRTRPGLRTVKP